MGWRGNPISFLTTRMWRYSEGNRRNVLLYSFLFVVANLLSFLEPLVLAKILNIVQEQGVHWGNLSLLLGTAALMWVLHIGFWSFHGPARVLEVKNSFFVKANYKKYLVDGVMSLPSQWHTDHHSGNTIDKIEKGTRGLFDYSRRTYEIIETLVRLISSYFALVYFNLHSAYIVLFFFIFTIWMILRFDETLRKQYRELFRADHEVSAKIYDTISNISTVIILRLEKLLSKEIFRKIMRPFTLYSKNVKMNEVKWFLVSMCASAMTLFVLASFFYTSIKGGDVVMVGTISALYFYVNRINQVFFRFAYRYGDIVRYKAGVQNAEEISVEFKDKKKVKVIDLNRDWNKIHIDNLNFSYHGNEGGDLHLKDVSLELKRKERVALVGESGSGKTTFLKLIRDLYEPKDVNMFIDSIPIKQGFGAISPHITLIPQEPEIFATTIKENITLGVTHKESYIRKFTDLACFTKVIDRLPKKFNSSIVEKGVNLSGGEKQRLALARGLIAAVNKPVLLLDEPTSSVDSRNEMKIYSNIFNEFKDKTIISTIHRLHLLPKFDKVLYFKKGRIVASGTLKEILKNSKEFKLLWVKYHKAQKK